MTFLGTTVPYYGGKQVANPANVVTPNNATAPSANINAPLGTVVINNLGTVYMAVKRQSGVTTWAELAASTGAVVSVNGTANQITASPTTGAVVLSLTGPYTPATYTAHGVLLGEGTSSIVAVAPNATVGKALVSTGASSDPAYGTVTVPGGGTGAVTLTGVLSGNGTSAVTASAVTQFALLVGGASNAVGSIADVAVGQVLVSGGVSANPAFSATPTVTSLTATGNVSGASVTATGDGSGLASTIQLSNVNSTTISSGTGSVAMSTTNNATNAAWLKIYIGTTPYWIPAWTTNAP